MEMAKYIMTILKSQLIIVWSWGFHQPMELENGLRFRVSGFKFKGSVEIVYNEGHDLFDVRFIKASKVVATGSDIYFDMLVSFIDNFVERTSDYEERVSAEYSLG